jgi:hypothetical protein
VKHIFVTIFTHGLGMEPMRKPNSLVNANLVCDACKRAYPLTEKSVCLTRWTGQLNSNKISLVGFERGSVVTSVCWKCVENTANPLSTISCYKPPLLKIEKTSIVQYTRKSGTGDSLHPSAKSPPLCMNCHMSITEESLCVYSRLTTEHDVDPSIKNKRLDEQKTGLALDREVVDVVRFFGRASWNSVATKIQNPIDVGITCASCSIKLWGIDFSTTLK